MTIQIFRKWAGTDKDSQKILKSATTKCPICALERTNLKIHLIKIHGVDEINAKGVKSQLGMFKKRKKKPDAERKRKPRNYKRRNCPIPSCFKIHVRLENHLRETHKIKSEKLRKKLLREAVPVEEYSTESEVNNSECESSSDELFHLKKVLKKGGKHYISSPIQTIVVSEDSDDADWLAETCNRYRNQLGKLE